MSSAYDPRKNIETPQRWLRRHLADASRFLACLRDPHDPINASCNADIRDKLLIDWAEQMSLMSACVQDRLVGIDTPKCEYCDGPAVGYCPRCDAFLCGVCGSRTYCGDEARDHDYVEIAGSEVKP